MAEAVQKLLENNKVWAEKTVEEQADFFTEMAKGQTPEYLWIGCADSRVTNHLATGTKPGEMFTHRNVGNVVVHSDMNCMSSLEYSVLQLKVKHVIVCGHYKCGAVAASLTLPQKNPMITNHWITHIRAVRDEYAEELEGIKDPDAKLARLCELNAVKQAFKVCTTPTIQTAWANGQEVTVHALIFDLATGRLKRLAGPISSPNDVELNKGAFWEEDTEPVDPTKAGVKKSLQEKITKDLASVLQFEEA